MMQLSLTSKFSNIKLGFRNDAISVTINVPAGLDTSDFYRIFPGLSKTARSSTGVKITSAPLVIDEAVAALMAPAVRDGLLLQISGYVAAGTVTAVDTITGNTRSATDINAFANTNSWSASSINYVTGTLASILALPATTVPAGSRALPNDVAGCTLEMGADGKWVGTLGVFASDAAMTTATGGNYANLSVGNSQALVSGNCLLWDGAYFSSMRILVDGGATCCGDSITDNLYSLSVLAYQINGIGPVDKYAYPGKRSDEICDLIPQMHGRVRLLAGTNDMADSVALPTFYNNYLRLVNKILSWKTTLELVAIPPRDVQPISHNAYNFVIWWISRMLGLKFYNPWKTVTALSGGYVSGASSDGSHPTTASHFALAAILAAKSAAGISDSPLPFSNNGGLIINSSFIDTDANGIPDSWSVLYSNSGCIPSIAAGSFGNALTLTCNFTASQYALQQVVTVIPGHTLLLMSNINIANPINLWGSLVAVFQDAGGNNVAGGGYFPYKYSASGNFTILTTLVVPPGSVSAQVSIAAGGTAYPATGAVTIQQPQIFDLTASGVTA